MSLGGGGAVELAVAIVHAANDGADRPVGFYRHPELGFWFHYPEDWFVESTGSNFPAVVIYDDDDPVRLLAGGRGLEEGTELADFA